MRREEDADADADANANDDELQSSNPKRKLNTRTRRAYHYDSRLVATLLDVCITNGNREGYMKELAVHVQVHTYGNCGVPCPGNSTSECLQYLSKFYKFLLVFEADICEHYVSNLVYQVLQTSMVPVVFGGGDYSKDLQPGSYIDAMPQTPENLAHFLIYLDKHQPVFNTYTQ
ncbi:alpha-(1,3)-fucosyltransferase C, partial [Eurytemora carolleeae]|uniref:alpha-(1,3)-fucosyltransferase C n=1 Tax=Eurytemora carolleeae TaxID=1294199 RepID=UPI000C781F4B